MLCEIHDEMDPLEDICSLIDSAICDDPPFTVREGKMIRDGFNAELDELRSIVADGEPVRVNCDYCGSTYVISLEQIQQLIDARA